MKCLAISLAGRPTFEHVYMSTRKNYSFNSVRKNYHSCVNIMPWHTRNKPFINGFHIVLAHCYSKVRFHPNLCTM